MQLNKLFYFSFRARGEAPRILFLHSKLPWEDVSVSWEDWGSGQFDKNSIPAGRSGSKQLPVLSLPDGTRIPESLDICQWIATKCEPSLMPATKEGKQKAEKVFLYPEEGKPRLGLVNPLLNFLTEEKAAEMIPSYAASVPKYLSFFSQEIGTGPFVCGESLCYADFLVFHCLDNLCTLFGKDNILESDATLKTFYNKMCLLPAVSERLKARPQAGCGTVGRKESILFQHKDPSQLDFVQKAWREKDQ